MNSVVCFTTERGYQYYSFPHCVRSETLVNEYMHLTLFLVYYITIRASQRIMSGKSQLIHIGLSRKSFKRKYPH